MAVSPEFREYVLEMLEPLARALGPIAFRPMFGGGGLYQNEVMFALITRADILYLRTDDHNRRDYEEAGTGPFVTNAEKNTVMPYHEVPAEILESADAMCDWARKAVDAAMRARTHKPKGGKRKR